MYELVRQLKRKRVPIDGVGFQMHVDARFPPTEAQLRANFARFADLGLSINISELDVQVRNVAGTRADKLALQKQIYHRVVAACLDTPACEAVTTWGFTDKYSWIDSTFGADDPLPYDEALLETPTTGWSTASSARAGRHRRAPNLIATPASRPARRWFGFGIPSVTVDSKETPVAKRARGGRTTPGRARAST